MSDRTTIAWTQASWNPLRAAREPFDIRTDRWGWSCVRVSPGCTNCYAATWNKRMGTGLDYTVPDNARVEHFINQRQLLEPLHWRKPRRVFVCSMTDLFGQWVTDEQLDRIFGVMALTPQHTYQLLTKRPERMRAYMNGPQPGGIDRRRQLVYDAMMRLDLPHMPDEPQWPLRNVWLGVSAEDQQRADERIPILLDTPAAVRWVSARERPEGASVRSRVGAQHPRPVRQRRDRVLHEADGHRLGA